MASNDAYERASRQAYDDFTSLGRDTARANPLSAGLGALAREGMDGGFGSGWMGRVAHDAEGTMGEGLSGLKQRAKGTFDVGKDVVEKGMFMTDKAVLEGAHEYKRLESGGSFPLSPEFDKFNAGFVGRNFPEISEMFGTAEVKSKLAENQIEAAESALVHSGKTFDELRGLGLTRQQVFQEAQNRTQDPKELELVNSELDRVYGKLDESGWVKPDKNITDVADKVTTARQGGDPTANKVPEEVVKKAQFDEGDIYAKAIDKTANDFHSKHITPQNWYESRSFNMGLMRFGLGLLSGEDYATAFSNAAQDYTKLSDREKREAYADELLSSGYSQASVMQWVDEGKSNILDKPETWDEVKDKDTGITYQRSSKTGRKDVLHKPEKRNNVITEVDGKRLLVDSQTGETVKTLGSTKQYRTFRDPESGSLLKENIATGDVVRVEGAYGYDENGNLISVKPGKGGKGGKGGEVSDVKSPFGGDPYTLAPASTANERQSEVRGQRAISAAANVDRVVDLTREELKNSSWTSPTVYEGHLSNIMAEAETPTGSYAIEYLKQEYPALAQYAAVMNATLNAVMRDDSGAAIGNAEQRKYITSLAPRPTDPPETAAIKRRQMDDALLNIASSGNSRIRQALSDLKAGKVQDVIVTSKGPIVIDLNGEPWPVERIYQKDLSLIN